MSTEARPEEREGTLTFATPTRKRVRATPDAPIRMNKRVRKMTSSSSSSSSFSSPPSSPQTYASTAFFDSGVGTFATATRLLQCKERFSDFCDVP